MKDGFCSSAFCLLSSSFCLPPLTVIPNLGIIQIINCPGGGIGIRSRLRACACIGVRVRVSPRAHQKKPNIRKSLAQEASESLCLL